MLFWITIKLYVLAHGTIHLKVTQKKSSLITMNEKELIPNPPYNCRRIWRKIMMVIASLSLIPTSLRVKFYKWGGVSIKGRCFIGSHVHFDGIYPNLIEIGEGCIITSGTHILTHFFNTNDRNFYAGKVRIGNNVFIGMNTLIVNSVDIGDNAVIGAGSIVNRDIPAGEVWAGNPARIIKKI